MAASSAAALGPGAVLGGRYRLDRRIAAGGMATVWLASDHQLGRNVAVKVLSDVLAGETGYRARFRREAKLAAGLSHPNLVRVFDFGEEGGRPYLVMEHVSGATLAASISAGDGADVERLARELLGALAHIHAAGIVHRDVKPGNVLFDPAGRAKLTDFGIARPEDATRITQTGEVMGTLRYMAPEVLAGEPATPRADLYSTGVLLAETCGDDASPALRSLIDRLRDPSSDGRPPSAEAALAELDGVPTAPTARLSRRRELEIPLWAVLAALGAAAAVALAIAIASSGGGSASHPARRQAAGGSTHRSHASGGSGSSSTAHQPTTPSPASDTTTQPSQPAPPPAKPAPKVKAPKPEKPAKPEKVPPGREKHGKGAPPGHGGGG